MACHGDSGGPTMWKDKNDKNRFYLMGIIEGGSLLIDEKCGVPENNFFFTIATTVPGKVLNWIKGLDYPEINKCLN